VFTNCKELLKEIPKKIRDAKEVEISAVEILLLFYENQKNEVNYCIRKLYDCN
jgi:hypothetical protein